MKTSLKTVVTTALTALVLSTSVFTSFAAEKVNTMDVNPFNPEIKRVIVSGNVKVLLVQSFYEQVAVEDGYADKVSVKQVGHTLTVNSNEKNPVTVTVYVYEPYRIVASDKATVRTVGKFDVKHLQVMLKGDAVAYIKAKTESLYTVVNDRADLELHGSTANHIIKSDGLAKLRTDNFAALKIDRVAPENEVAMNVNPASVKK